MFYRFTNGVFIEAETFNEAKLKFIEVIINEEEKFDGWHKCTCLGLSHRYDCSLEDEEGDIPF